MGNSARRDIRKAELADVARQALELRRRGHTYDDIAEQLGLTDRSAARKKVQAAIEAIPVEAAEEVRIIELTRLDRMLEALTFRIEDGDVDAIDRALKIQVRRAALLGLDAPKRTELSGPSGGPIQVSPTEARRLMAERFASLDVTAAAAPLEPACSPPETSSSEAGAPDTTPKS